MGAESFRAWLDDVVQQAAAALGITLARAKALVADVIEIAGNAGQAFKDSFRDEYQRARRVRPRRRNG